MLIGNHSLPFVDNYVNQLNHKTKHYPKAKLLTPGQQAWLSFCLMGIIVTESVCWQKFVRAGLQRYSEALLSWYFRYPITWDYLLAASLDVLIETFALTNGILVLDDTGKKRSKVTTQIPYVHYFKDKESTGNIRGQEIIFLIFVTPLMTIPVAFAFYQPDPAYTLWAKEEKRLKKKGVIKSKRPQKPAYNPDYPTKQELAFRLLEQFCQEHPYIKINGILADALYGNNVFMNKASELKGGTQTISQLRSNQKIQFRGKSRSVSEYFKAYSGVPHTVSIRGKITHVIMNSARLYVEAQQCKRLIVAIRYPDEKNYRYLMASDLSWRTEDVILCYSLRWLVEVAIEDLKVHEGWGKATKQPGVDGSRRVLILSLLCDHCLLLHPEQKARIADQKPLSTIGSLQRHLQMDALLAWLHEWLKQTGTTRDDALSSLANKIQTLFPLEPSKKHIHSMNWEQFKPSPSLKYRNSDAQAIFSG